MIPIRLSIVLPTESIATSKTCVTARRPLVLTRGATLSPFEVELLNPTSDTTAPFTTAALPDGFTGIKVLAKAKPSDADFLFETHDLVADGEDEDLIYTGTLSLNTDELNAKFPAGNTQLQWLTVHLDVLFTRANGTYFSAVTNWPCRVLRGNTTGEEGTPATLPNPDDYIGERAVRYDVVQSLDDTQKGRARDNIAAASKDAPVFTSVPTSDPASVGAIWSNGGVLMISAG